MKEYLIKDPQTGKYWVSNNKEYGFVCEVPEGGNYFVDNGGEGLFFKKLESRETFDVSNKKSSWKRGAASMREYLDAFKECVVVWRRGTLVEYLNPANWSLHVVDVDNDAAGEDWIKVPEGAEWAKLWDDGCKYESFIEFYRGHNEFFSETKREWMRGNDQSTNKMGQPATIVWDRRHTQPEELPFVDDEPKGQKHDSAKPRMSLLPKGVLSSVISVLEFGAKKYQEDNWKKVGNAKTRYYDAMQRHIGAWWDGEKNDPETGEHHLAHAICCAMFLIWFDKEQSQ